MLVISLEKILVVFQYPTGTDVLETLHPYEPISYLSYSNLIFAVVIFDVRTSEIGDRGLIAIPLLFQDEDNLGLIRRTAKATTTEVHTEFKWHVQTIVFTFLTGLTATEVVNRISARSNQVVYLVYTWLGSVATFRGETRAQAKTNETEKNALKDLFVVFVEWTVYEYTLIELT